MSDYEPPNLTRRSRIFDPDQTVKRSSAEATQPSHQVSPPPVPQPQPPSRKKRRRRRRRSSCFGCLLRLVIAGGVFAVAFTVLMALLYIVAPPPRTNILVLGIDARPGQGVVTRADTVILTTVDPRHSYIGMLSIPRDLYVDVPGYGKQRINAAHIFGEDTAAGGGPQLAAQTVANNFGVPVHRTVRLNFEAFVAIVDAAGGVTIDVENYFIDYEYPTADYGTMVVEFQAGTQHMDGARALQYARIRHDSSDFERAERQQQVIEALARQLTKPENWWRWPDVYLAFSQNVDTDLTILDMALITPTIIVVGPDGIDRQVLTREMAVGTTTSAGAAVLEPQWYLIDPLVDEMFRR